LFVCKSAKVKFPWFVLVKLVILDEDPGEVTVDNAVLKLD